MKSYLYIILILTTSIGLISCEKEATIDPPKANPKLVIGAFISPQDTLIQIQISTSTPIFGTRSTSGGSSSEISDATVVLSDGNSSMQIPYDSKKRRYTINADLFVIQAGKTYYLSVSTPDGLKVDAQCTVPEANNSLTIEEVDSTSSSQKIYKVTLKWEDNPLTQDHYRLLGNGTVSFSMNKPPYPIVMILDEKDQLISDAQASSSAFTRKGRFEVWSANNYLKKISCYLLSTDDHYFKYIKSVRSYSGDNPFAEPTLLYSNINGGLGVFCAYNQYLVVKDL